MTRLAVLGAVLLITTSAHGQTSNQLIIPQASGGGPSYTLDELRRAYYCGQLNVLQWTGELVKSPIKLQAFIPSECKKIEEQIK